MEAGTGGGAGGGGSLPAPPTTCASRDCGFSRRPLLVPGGPTHLVHRLRLETIRKFTHKMRPRLVLALRVVGGKITINNKKNPSSRCHGNRPAPFLLTL